MSGSPRAWRILALAAPLVLGACKVPDASGADQVWAPKGINAANLAAMVANPADLVRGRGDTGPEHKLAAQAVLDLWTNPTGAAGGGAAGGGAASLGASGGSASGGGALGGGASGGGAAGGGGSSGGASGGGGGTAAGTGAGS
jgi:hypothetical protein